MIINTDTIKAIYIDHFQQIYSRCTPELMALIVTKLTPYKNEIVAAFYQAMLEVSGSSGFLNNELIEKQLTNSMSKWVDNLFIIRDDTELELYVDYQLTVGRVHARINLPPHLFNCGVRVLKQQINRALRRGDVSLKQYNDTSTLANMLIDLCTSLMNESFFGDMVVGERKSQSLQMHLTGSELALKCEQLRSDTFSWHSNVLSLLRENKSLNNQSIPHFSHSEIGLWVTHKAPLFFLNSEYVQMIQADLPLIDQHIDKILSIIQSNKAEEHFDSVINELELMVKRVTTSLSSLVEQSISMDSGRDPLTKMFNRRYLDTVLQKESRYCMVHNKTYVLMLIDIDHFKKINDSYGHGAGDRVLEQIGTIMNYDIRAGDFVFRYGGEEFLLLLTDMKIEFVESIANKILNNIRDYDFNIGQEHPIKCTISIGIAAHLGHPDYNRVISNADKALYQAKQTGRNKFVIINDLNY